MFSPILDGTPGWNRTIDLWFIGPMLLPLSYGGIKITTLDYSLIVEDHTYYNTVVDRYMCLEASPIFPIYVQRSTNISSLSLLLLLVGTVGLEPTLSFENQILSLTCLPIPTTSPCNSLLIFGVYPPNMNSPLPIFT